MKILVIEADPMQSLWSQEMRQSSRDDQSLFHVTQVDSLALGLAHLQMQTPDIILVDLEAFSALYEKCKDISIVILTQMPISPQVFEVLKCGAQDAIYKGAAISKMSIYFLLKKSIERHSHLSEERKKSIELTQQKNVLEVVLNTVDDGILAIDKSNNILFANRVMQAVIGHSSSLMPQEGMVKRYGLFLTDKITHAPKERIPTTRALMGEYVINEEFFLKNSFYPEGVFLLMSASPLRNANKEIIGAIINCRDINEIKKTEQSAQVAHQVKSDFLANMSHELRTPLNSILGLTEYLKISGLDQNERKNIEIIHQSGLLLLATINNILDYSKIETGKAEVENIDFDVTYLLEETTGMFGLSARQKGIKIDFQIDPDVPKKLKGDMGSLSKILINLLSNAVDFTQTGGVSVRVMKNPQIKIATEIRFEVEDTGIGISEQNQEKIFAPFIQVDSSVTRKHGGIGLGLSTCCELIKQMNGSMGVCSHEGRGSTFWFQVILEPSLLISQAFHLSPSKGKESLAVKKMRILIVEDNQFNQYVLAKILEKLGYRADIAANGQEALEMLSQFNYDLVLMDCMMPIVDGYEASRRIRANKSAPFNQIPIIAVTANVLNGEGSKCLEAGMNDYLGKPVNIRDLESKLTHWLTHDLDSQNVQYLQQLKLSGGHS